MVRVIFSAALTFMVLGHSVQASEHFPSEPIRIVLPIASGGTADAVTRMHADLVSKTLGVPVIVESRPGGGGSIALANVLSSPADGHTLLFMDTTMYASLFVQKETLNLDVSKDLRGVFAFNSSPQVLAVAGNSGINSLEDLVVRAKSRPDGLTYGTQFVGGPAQVLGHLFSQAVEGKMRVVPFSSSGQFTLDLVAERVDFGFNGGAFHPNIENGNLKILATATAERLPTYPEVPTMAELGYPDVQTTLHFGLVARSEVPDDVIEKIYAAFDLASENSEIVSWIKGRHLLQDSMTASGYKEILDTEAVRQESFLREALGIQ